MKKKSTHWLVHTLLLSGITSASHVMAAEVYDTSPFSGFYIGGGLGGSFSSAKERSNTHSTTTSANTQIVVFNTRTILNHSSVHAHRKSRMAAGLYAGYGVVWCENSYYLGLEAFLNYSGFKTKSRHNLPLHNTLNSTFQGIALSNAFDITEAIISSNRLQRHEGGVDLRSGVFLTPCTLLYARLGVGYNKWSLHSKLNALFSENSAASGTPVLLAAVSLPLHTNKEKKLGTLRLGMGLEQNLCENITIRADYVNTNYRSIHVHNTFVVADANGNTATFTKNTKISGMFNNSVMLGVSYYW